MIFLNFKKKHTMIKFREFFQKLQQHMAYNPYMGCRGTLKHFFKEFLTHFCENPPKNWNFVEFDPNSWQIVKNTQILYFYIALCKYFGYTSSESYSGWPLRIFIEIQGFQGFFKVFLVKFKVFRGKKSNFSWKLSRAKSKNPKKSRQLSSIF